MGYMTGPIVNVATKFPHCDRSCPDLTHPTCASRSIWQLSIQFNRRGVSIMTTVDQYRCAKTAPQQLLSVGYLCCAALVGLAVICLLVFRPDPAQAVTRYGNPSLIIDVPAAVPFTQARLEPRHAHRYREPKRLSDISVSQRQAVVALSDDSLPASETDTPTRMEAIATAFKTGDVAEWNDGTSGHGFAVAGPRYAAGSQQCRELSLLVRREDGFNSVSKLVRCG